MGATSNVTSPSSGVHEAALGLVRDAVAVELHHHGETDVDRRRHRLVGSGGDPFVGEGHAEGAEERLRCSLRQGA
jgi:hypothetical protein